MHLGRNRGWARGVRVHVPLLQHVDPDHDVRDAAGRRAHRRRVHVHEIARLRHVAELGERGRGEQRGERECEACDARGAHQGFPFAAGSSSCAANAAGAVTGSRHA